MNPLIIILPIVIILCILIIFYIQTYNKIAFIKTKIEKSEGIIDDALRQKYDLISKLNTMVKKVINKKDYLKEFSELKNKRISNYDMDRTLTETVLLLYDFKNDFKELNTKEYADVLEEIRLLDQTLTASKNYFNKNTSELNELIRKFPSNIISKIYHYKIKPFFDGKNMQDAVIDDFKL